MWWRMIMKTAFYFILLTSMCAVSASEGGLRWGNALARSFKIFDAERDRADNPYVQEVSLRMRPQYQWGYVDPAGGAGRVKGASAGVGRRGNDEWRRFRIGVQAKALRYFTLLGDWDIGGLNGRYKHSDGRWERGRSQAAVYELYVQGNFKPVIFTLGKSKPTFIGEYRISDSKLPTIERSDLVSQLAPESLYGVSFSNSDTDTKWGWLFGVWLNGQRDSLWLEPTFHTGTNAMTGVSVSRSLGEQDWMHLDWMHSFMDESCTEESASYEGPGARDVIALTWEAKRGKFGFMAEAMTGFNVTASTGRRENAENVGGISLIPTYRISPRVEAVFRYALAIGSNAVESGGRYASTNSTYSSTCDLSQAFYFGVNFYLDPEKVDLARIMLGAEYAHTSGRDAMGERGFTGWQYSAALRFNF